METKTHKPILFQPWKASAILSWDFEANGPMHTRRFTGLEDVNQYKGRLSGEDSSLGPLGYRGLEISDYYIHPKYKAHFRRFPHQWHWFLGVQSKEFFKGEFRDEINPIPIKCPYGGGGDTLWGREAWRVTSRSHFHTDNFQRVTLEYAGQATQGPLTKTFDRPAGERLPGDGNRPLSWRPSIFLPKWASRITLQITSVRVEIVNTISENDAWREGVVSESGDYRGAFLKAFEEIHGPGALNKWAWVIEFVRL